MNEHLFKLKKDGKTVGYLELLVRTPYGYPVLWFRDLGRLDEGREWHSGNNVQADSIHPFVTKDKNGKDVFAGDEVISSDGLRKYKVTWDERRCRWWLCGIDKPWAVNEPIWEEYTLIEEKENE
jgi:hypothetical protein